MYLILPSSSPRLTGWCAAHCTDVICLKSSPNLGLSHLLKEGKASPTLLDHPPHPLIILHCTVMHWCAENSTMSLSGHLVFNRIKLNNGSFKWIRPDMCIFFLKSSSCQIKYKCIYAGVDMWWIYLGYLVKADLPPGECWGTRAHAKKKSGWSDTGQSCSSLGGQIKCCWQTP